MKIQMKVDLNCERAPGECRKLCSEQGQFFFLPKPLSQLTLDHTKLALLAGFFLFFALRRDREPVHRLNLTLHSIVLYVK